MRRTDMQLSRRLGRFEQLETRTVLSASMSPLPMDFEIENVGSTSYYDATPAPSHYDFGGPLQQELGPTSYGWRDQPRQFDSRQQIWFIIIVNGSANASELPQKLRSESVSPSDAVVSPPLMALAQKTEADNLPTDERTSVLPFQIETASWRIGSLIESGSTVSASNITESNETANRDAAFQDYWAEHVLDSLEHEWDVDREELAEITTDIDEDDETLAILDSDVLEPTTNLSKEVVDEIHGLDSLLRSLHRFDVERKQPQSRASQDRIVETQDIDPTANVLRPVEQSAAASRPTLNDVAAGGMVLLQPYADGADQLDLKAVFAQGMDRAGRRRLGVEAPLGIYQALDVGNAPVGATAKGQNDTPANSKSAASTSRQAAAETAQPS